MRIAICDDEKAQAGLLHKLVRQWAARAGAAAEIDVFHSAEAFLFAWPGQSFDVLLLDIQMQGMNGMELARTIRRRDEVMAIVFVTGFSEYMDEGYDVSALHYLMKPVNAQKLFACLDRAVRRAGGDVRTVLVSSGGDKIRLTQCDILFIEAFAHTVQITLAGSTLVTGMSIGELDALLDSSLFVRPHRSYIVGLKYIRQIGRDALTLDNDVRIPVSRRRYEDVNRAFISFYRGDAHE